MSCHYFAALFPLSIEKEEYSNRLVAGISSPLIRTMMMMAGTRMAKRTGEEWKNTRETTLESPILQSRTSERTSTSTDEEDTRRNDASVAFDDEEFTHLGFWGSHAKWNKLLDPTRRLARWRRNDKKRRIDLLTARPVVYTLFSLQECFVRESICPVPQTERKLMNRWTDMTVGNPHRRRIVFEFDSRFLHLYFYCWILLAFICSSSHHSLRLSVCLPLVSGGSG